MSAQERPDRACDPTCSRRFSPAAECDCSRAEPQDTFREQYMILDCIGTFLETNPELDDRTPLHFGPVEEIPLSKRLDQEITIDGTVYLVSVRLK